MKDSRKTSALINILIVTGIVVILNMLAAEYFIRLDFTENRRYTISDSTKKILRELENPVSIKFYISEELPPRVVPIRQDIMDMLTEYRRYGEGNIDLSVLIPEKNDDIRRDAEDAGIRQAQINVIGKNKQEVQNMYMGIALHCLDKTEALPVVTNTSDLEYQLTSRILKLSQKHQKKIVFLDKAPNIPPNINPAMKQKLMQQMGPSHSIDKDTRFVAEQLREQYDVQQKKIQPGDLVPADTKILVIHGASSLTDWEQYAVDQYLVSGGNVVVLQSGMKLAQGAMAQAKRLNYADLLSTWGITINNDYVFDQYNYPAMIPSGNSRYIMPFPLWIKVSPEQISDTLPDTVRDVGSLGFTFTSSLTIDEKEGLSYIPVAESSSRSWTQNGTVVIDPQNMKQAPADADTRPRTLAALVQGSFPSSFTKSTLPEQATADSFSESGTSDGSLVVFGTPQLILDQAAKRFSANILFFLNITDYLADNDALTGIRSRGKGLPPVSPDIGETTQSVIKWTGTLFVPLIVIIFGILRMLMRKRISGRSS